MPALNKVYIAHKKNQFQLKLVFGTHLLYLRKLLPHPSKKWSYVFLFGSHVLSHIFINTLSSFFGGETEICLYVHVYIQDDGLLESKKYLKGFADRSPVPKDMEMKYK